MSEKIFIGRIVEWNRQRGFGYVEENRRRVFLHLREFSQRHKAPEVGDFIRFSDGLDQQGRPCAKQAVHVNDGGRFRLSDGVALLVLLSAPGAAIYWTGDRGLGTFVAVCWAGISGLTYLAYAVDKKNALSGQQREPEKILHVLELLGGWPGAFVAQRRLRHKTSKAFYQFVFWSIVLVHEFVAIDFVRGWPVMHFLLNRISQALP